jgi:hypothetical protein
MQLLGQENPSSFWRRKEGLENSKAALPALGFFLSSPLLLLPGF